MNFPNNLSLGRLIRYPKDHPLSYRMMVYITLCSFVFIMLSLTFHFQKHLH